MPFYVAKYRISDWREIHLCIMMRAYTGADIRWCMTPLGIVIRFAFLKHPDQTYIQKVRGSSPQLPLFCGENILPCGTRLELQHPSKKQDAFRVLQQKASCIKKGLYYEKKTCSLSNYSPIQRGRGGGITPEQDYQRAALPMPPAFQGGSDRGSCTSPRVCLHLVHSLSTCGRGSRPRARKHSAQVSHPRHP